ncbi:unnamed protein product [Vicia faba]|uniref:Transmembrane protein n=1 Tax=Vicia faba TaxID=3906 RepID=A0AAV0ZQD8_VICFA|nr:unnamed protein product [Vicia faba]
MAGSSKNSMSFNARFTPKYGHGLSMKVFVSKSTINLGRKYWKYKFWGKEEDCQLFYWDDEYFCASDRKGILEDDDGCNRCDVMIEYLRKSGSDFGREFGSNMCSKEMEDMNNKLDNTRKKFAFVIVVLICSWVYFVLVLAA